MKVENHANVVGFHFAYYNFLRAHKALRMSPAMAVDVSDRLWEVSDLVAVLHVPEAKRGAYKARVKA